MKWMLIGIIAFISFIDIRAVSSDENLLKQLDKALARKIEIMIGKEARIDSIKRILDSVTANEDRFRMNRMIYNEYKTYQYDSAYQYVLFNIEKAQLMERKDLQTRSKLDLAFILTSSGLYKESVSVLESINTNSLTEEMWLDYYEYFSRVYLDLTRFVGINMFSDDYWNTGRFYLDSLLAISDGRHQAELFFLGQQKMFNQDLAEAEKLYLKLLDNLQGYSQYYSMTAATLSFVYGVNGNKDMQRKYLIMSVLSDVECSITENESLHSLALLLFDDGNTRKAHDYIKISLADANFYNARLRRVEIARSQPIIEKAFLTQLAKQSKRLYILLIFISVLSLVLVIVVYYIVRQMSELRQSRKLIQETNLQLQELNLDLLETNKIKEEYIGHFLNLCSQYIDKIEQFNQLVNRKIKVGQVDALFALTGSNKVVEDELDELLLNFDRIFLKLFPDFVASFNALFLPEEQFTLKKDELLNTELRIFALVRLGVNDSSKIAKFLRYAPNTVYTYRTKIKNKSIILRDDFEMEVMKIGSFRGR